MPNNKINNIASENGDAGSGNATMVSTQVPGVDMSQVITSSPHLVKENSAKVEVKAINGNHRK